MANKFTNYFLLMAGVNLLFYFFGLIGGGATDTLISLLLNINSLASSSKMLIFIGLPIGVLAASFGVAVLGFRADLVVFAVAVTPLIGFGWDFLVVFNLIASINAVFAVLVLSPLMFFWVLTVLEWWRGVTN